MKHNKYQLNLLLNTTTVVFMDGWYHNFTISIFIIKYKSSHVCIWSMQSYFANFKSVSLLDFYKLEETVQIGPKISGKKKKKKKKTKQTLVLSNKIQILNSGTFLVVMVSCQDGKYLTKM